MKYLKVIVIITFLINVQNYQAQAEVSEGQLMIEEKMRTAWMTDLAIPQDQAREYYSDYMDDKYDVKVEGDGFLANKDILRVEEQVITSLSDKAMDIFVMFEEIDKANSRMKLVARNGYDLFFNSDHDPSTFEKLKQVMIDFHATAIATHYQELLEEQQKRMEDIMKSKSKAESSIKDNEKEIAKNIEENEELKKENSELKSEAEKEGKKLEQLKSDITHSKQQLNIKN